MKIFITGSGLVGNFSAQRLCGHGHSIILFDKNPSRLYIKYVLDDSAYIIEHGDVRNTTLLTKLLQKHKPDCVVHTAAALRNMMEENPYLGVSINTLGPTSVILSAAKAGVKRVVFCSSLSVYNYSTQNGPIKESGLLKPSSVYDATKLSGEYLFRTLTERYGIDLVILRLASVYGCGLFRGGAWLGRQLQSLLLDLLGGKNSVVEEKDFGTNEYVYVKDVAQAIERSCTKNLTGINVFNIGSDEIISAWKLTKILAGITKSNNLQFKEVLDTNTVPDFMKRKYPFSLKMAKEKLGYIPEFTFLKGISDYINYLMPIVKRTRRF